MKLILKDKGGNQILLKLTWELKYPQKIEINRKRGGSFESYSVWEGANDLPWGRKGLSGGPGVGRNCAD